jgi:hypothetical protein
MTSSSSTAAAALSSSISGAPTLSTHSGGGGGGGSEWGFLGGDDEDGGGDWIAQQFSGGGGEELGGRDALIFLIDARESMLVPLSRRQGAARGDDRVRGGDTVAENHSERRRFGRRRLLWHQGEAQRQRL